MKEATGWNSQRNFRRAGMAGAFAGIATGVVLFGPRPMIAADLAHQVSGNKTPVERAVEDMVDATYDTAVFVHCAPTGTSDGHDTQGRASSLYHTIRLTPAICATIGNIITSPSAIDAADANVVLAVGAVAHEASHVDGAGLYKEHDEGVTQCLTAQRSAEVAEGFGVPSDKALAIGKAVAASVFEAPADDYAIPAGCANGDIYDINAPGDLFPYDPVEAFINGG